MSAEQVPAVDRPAGLRVDQLRGFRIGVTSDRRSGDLITALERRGATVVHAPALRIAPHDQDAQLIAETEDLISAAPDLVLITTGYGMRRWFEVADAAGLGHQLSAVLDRARILARGPKALGAVRAAGLEAELASEADTTAALVDRVIAEGLTGRVVAVQQHGYTDESLLDRLAVACRRLLTVTPYRWIGPQPNERLIKLIDTVSDGTIDAITYTSAPGAEATLAAARSMGRLDAFVAACQHAVVSAAVGPVTAAPLIEAGIAPILPDRYRLGALIRLVSEHLDQHRVQRYERAGVRLELRGRCLTVRARDETDGRVINLGPSALAIFRALAAGRGVVSRADLMRCLPEAPDDHALEVAMSRLRQTLGVPGLITTVVKRGYRLGS